MRLIDAEPIEKFIEDGLNNPDKLKAFGHDAIEVLTEIHFASTIDPESLRQKAEWKLNEDGKWSCTYCESLAIEHPTDSDWQVITAFCPNCGADMRKEAHNEC